MSTQPIPAGPNRLLSLDVYRGFTMFFMASAGFGFSALADNPGWQWLARQVQHIEWTGFLLWDLIQPSFIFIVGAAMPFAFAARSAKNQGRAEQFRHVFKRSLHLLVIGCAIVAIHKGRILIDLTTVLQQIAIAYFFAFFVLGRGIRVQLITALAVLAAHTLCFVLWPGAGEAGPWAINANFASYLEQLVFGRMDAGGYTAFNAISSISTVIFGIIAGEMVRRDIPGSAKVRNLVLVGLACLVAGALLHPVIPVVKRIWTSSWTIFSAGWAYLLLALFYWLIEVRNIRRWSFIFMVIGMNSISIYVFFQMMRANIDRWLWTFTQPLLGPAGDIGFIIQAWLVLAIHVYVTYWLYKRKIFLKVG